MEVSRVNTRTIIAGMLADGQTSRAEYVMLLAARIEELDAAQQVAEADRAGRVKELEAAGRLLAKDLEALIGLVKHLRPDFSADNALHYEGWSAMVSALGPAA